MTQVYWISTVCPARDHSQSAREELQVRARRSDDSFVRASRTRKAAVTLCPVRWNTFPLQREKGS